MNDKTNTEQTQQNNPQQQSQPEQDTQIQISQQLEQFFSIEEKYYYIDKLGDINNKIDYILRSPKISSKLSEDSKNLLLFLNQVTYDFLQAAPQFDLDTIKDYYNFFISTLNAALNLKENKAEK